MKKTKLDRIINLIREEMMGAGAPTNNVGSGNIAGAISIISFVVSPIGQRVVGTILTQAPQTSIINETK